MKISWFRTDEIKPCNCLTIGQGKRDFIERTILLVTGILRDTISNHEFIGRKGYLQSLTPEAKLIGIALLVIATSLSKGITPLLILYPFSIMLALASGIRLSTFIIRVWLFIPLFTCIIAIPAIFLVPGEPILSVDIVHITKEGLLTAATLILRVATSVSFIILLTLTTRWNRILTSLQALFIPASFVMVLSMTYRYLYLFLRTVEDMHYAFKSRLITWDRKEGRRWVGRRIGYLFHRSMSISNEVYDAMVSRGFDRELKAMEGPAFRRRDLVWLSLSTGILVVVFMRLQ